MSKEINNIKNRINEINLTLELLSEGKFLSSYGVGDIINMKFRDVSISLRKIGSNIYSVVNSGESTKIKKDDLLRIIDEDMIIEPGEKIEFEIFRKTLDYKTDPIIEIS